MLTRSYVHTFIRSYVHTFIRSYAYTLTRLHSYTLTLIRSYAHTLIRSYVHMLTRSYAYTFIRSHVHTFIRSYAYTLTRLHSYTLTLIRSYVHTLIRSYVHTLIRSYVHTLTRTRTRTHTRTHAHTHAHTHARTRAHNCPSPRIIILLTQAMLHHPPKSACGIISAVTKILRQFTHNYSGIWLVRSVRDWEFLYGLNIVCTKKCDCVRIFLLLYANLFDQINVACLTVPSIFGLVQWIFSNIYGAKSQIQCSR